MEKELSQERLIKDSQSLANLQVPNGQPRNRNSAEAMGEQLQPRKHRIRPMDSGKHKIMIEPGGDGDETALGDARVAIARIRLERIERGKARGYVQNEIEPLKGRFCTCCGNTALARKMQRVSSLT